MSMVTIKTADLIGPALDWAVCLAVNGFSVLVTSDYSTDWAQGGPLLDDNYWALPYRATHRHHLGAFEACTPGGFPYNGPTPLVAACRAIVASELGGEVQVPAELVQQ